MPNRPTREGRFAWLATVTIGKAFAIPAVFVTLAFPL